MANRSHPEVTFGAGKRQIILKGTEAIKAAGWTLWLLLVARAVYLLGGAFFLFAIGWCWLH
jgi:hypothetical protein